MIIFPKLNKPNVLIDQNYNTNQNKFIKHSIELIKQYRIEINNLPDN